MSYMERKILEDGEIIGEISPLSNNCAAHDIEFARRIEQAILANLDRILASVGMVGSMPGTDGFTMAAFKAQEVPRGTPLFVMKVTS